MTKQYSELIEDFLKSEGYQYHGNEIKTNFTLDIHGLNGSWKNNLIIDDCDGQFIVRCISPIKVSPYKIHPMINLLSRINNEYISGHYTIDFEEGEICLLMSISLLDNIQPEAHMRQLVLAAFSRFDKYLPAILSVNNTDIHPLITFIEIQSNPLQ